MIDENALKSVANRVGFVVRHDSKDGWYEAQQKGWRTIYFSECAMLPYITYKSMVEKWLRKFRAHYGLRDIRNIKFAKHASWIVLDDCSVPCNEVYAQVR